MGLPVIVSMLLVLSVMPVHGTELVRTVTADGSCERLVISGEDLSGECGTALVQMHYEDGRITVSAGTGGQAFFGLAEPEQMLIFSGPGAGLAWSDHRVDQVHAAHDGGASLLFSRNASGFCRYEDAGPGILVTCDATDEEGHLHELIYRTDGGPGFSF
jgi:hypothetical protein